MRPRDRSVVARIMGIALVSFLVNSSGLLLADAKPADRRFIPAATTTKPVLVDDTMIVTLSPGADSAKVKEVLDEVHGTVVRKLHINRDNYDILFVKPERGQEDNAIQKITSKK